MTASPHNPPPERQSAISPADCDAGADVTWSELADAAYLTAWFEATEPQRDWEPLPPVEPRQNVERAPQGEAARDRPPLRDSAGSAEGNAQGLVGARQTRHPSLQPMRPYAGRPERTSAGPSMPAAESAVGLPGALALGQALRPLRLTSPTSHVRHIDEESTAVQAAVTGLWLAQCTPGTERLLDLTVLVDPGPSYPVWRHLATGLCDVFEHSGAFRRIDIKTVDIGARVAALREIASQGHAIGSTAVDGRSVVVVLTDGGSAGWRNGDAAVLLNQLARHAHVAVISLLPQQLWDNTLPTVARTALRPASAVSANRRLHVLHAARPFSPGRDLAAVPVLELSASSLRRWATMVASDGGRHELAALLTGQNGDRAGPGDAELGEIPDLLAGQDGLSPRDQVGRFRTMASPAAFSLACRLAAAPLNLPVMRLLQDSHPKAQWWNLAEILLFGLISPVSDDVEAPDRVSFDFPVGVREELLGLGTRLHTARVLRDVEDYLAPHLASRHPGGAALVAWQPPAALPQVTEETVQFVRPVQAALSVLAGPYLDRAYGLQAALTSVSPAAASQDSGRSGPDMQAVHQRDAAADAAQAAPTASVLSVAESDDRMTGGAMAPSVPEWPRSSGAHGVRVAPAPSPTVPPGPPAAAGPPVSSGGLVSVDHRTKPDSLPAKTIPPKMWGNVPQRNRNFTGRGELLEQLMQRLAVDEVAAVLPEAIHGMGGVGKSQIAVEYAYRHGKDYGLVWWIPAEQNNKIIQSLIELGERMGLRAGPEAAAVRTVLDALQDGHPYGNWLLVFDNAEDPAEVSKFFPTSGPGRILVTSRNSQWSTTASSLEVNVFTREESVALLRRRSPGIQDDAADRLASSLGDLPLAVEQAAVWLAETGMPVNQYLELFDRKCAEILRVAPPPDYEVPVAAAWNVSLERLRQEHPAALQLLQVCAFFAPEPIPWDWFSAVRNVSVPPALQSALDDPIKLGKAVREIGRYALARIDHRQSTIQLHRLVQRVLVEQMTPQEQAQMRHGAHELLVHADPGNPQLPPRWTRYSDLLPHVHSTNAAECGDAWTRRLVLNELRFLLARGDYAACKEFTAQVRVRWVEQLGREHEDTLAADQTFAEVMRQRGEYEEAYRLQRDLVERFRRVLGERHEDTQLALSRLAIHLRLRGDFYGARDMDQQAYETSLREFGPDEPNTLQAAHNYAVSLRLTGDAKQAYERDEDTWQRRLEVIGEDHVYTLGTLNSSYVDLQELGRYVEALEGQEQLAARARLLLGEDHPSTVLFLRELSVTRRKVGDHQGAYELSSKLLPVVRARYGPDSNEAMRTALNHATDLRQTGDLEAARVLGQQVMEQCRSTLGPTHPHTYATFTNLAVTLRLMGRVEEARALDQEAVDGLQEALRPEHARTLLARTNLASDLFASGQPCEALEMDAETADLSTRMRGEQHPATLAVRLNLSFDMTALGRTEEAQELYTPTLDAFVRMLGEDHPATQDARAHLRANCDIDLLNV